MSDMYGYETCCCGALIRVSSNFAYVERQLEAFREAHAPCRERWGGTREDTTFTYSVDVDEGDAA